MNFIFSRNKTFLWELKTYLCRNDLEVREIGDGILAVKCGENLDIYFDTGRWQLTIKVEEKFKTTIYPEHIEHTGVLPGKSYKHGVTTVEKVLLIVSKHLAPRATCYRLITDKPEPEPEPKKDSSAKPKRDVFDMFDDLFKQWPR